MDDDIFLSQPKYALDLLKLFKMDDCKSCATPYHSGVKLLKDYESPGLDATFYRQLANNMIYLTQGRPDPFFVVSMVSQFMHDP